MFRRTARSLTACLLLFSGYAHAESVYLNDWTVEGTSKTQWRVSADQRSVATRRNGTPSYLLSSDNYFNTRLTGTFGVDTHSDDDYIGFALGWSGTGDQASFLALHWKQGAQNGSAPGFTLAQVTGTQALAHRQAQQDAPGYRVLASNTGRGLGWQDNRRYGFELTYTQHHLSFTVRDLPDQNGNNHDEHFDLIGTQVFNIAGDFQAGRFGFLNHSQTRAHYGNLQRQDTTTLFVDPLPTSLTATPVPAPAAAGLGMMGSLALIGRRRRRA